MKIWKDIFPHRELVLKDAKVTATFNSCNYSGTEMSDGERVALYLMAQILCVPSQSIIIIDESEVYLHKSIMNRLWDKLEEYRKDCLFIYITHDIQFATVHKNSKKLWVHEYFGNNDWDYEFINGGDDVPEELLLEILGTRKNVLFVEGKKDSLDYSLYQHFYSDYSVIPCESCIKVMESTKALRKHNHLHHLSVF
ncbi:ATP-binding protein [Clostridium botulinum]|nr:ATP-binding protein [Clostridium botulinum]MBD5583088.1 ATP-binding protein [Clostridium botulinum]MBD5590059.1 ATP-binding protein [Clostridium botulinum]MBD5623029.1 ATP-binding protein [Clostridium botulinum]MBD5628188.1 ATP-binding protein [Clostridium botulinum]